jgi:hypothetical protein
MIDLKDLADIEMVDINILKPKQEKLKSYYDQTAGLDVVRYKNISVTSRYLKKRSLDECLIGFAKRMENKLAQIWF